MKNSCFQTIRRTLQWIRCHTIQTLLCTMQFWEEIIEKWLHGIIGIQKSQNIFMLGSRTHPLRSIHCLGKIRRGVGKRGNNWKTKGLWKDVLASSPGGSRWSITKRGVVSALGFLRAGNNNSYSSRNVSFPSLQAELGKNSLRHMVTLPGEVGGGDTPLLCMVLESLCCRHSEHRLKARWQCCSSEAGM